MLTERQRLSTYDLTRRKIGILPEVKSVLPPEIYDIPWIDEINEQLFVNARILEGKNLPIKYSRSLIKEIVTAPYILFDFSDEPELIRAQKIDEWRNRYIIYNDIKSDLYASHALRPAYPCVLRDRFNIIIKTSGRIPEDKVMEEFNKRSNYIREFPKSMLDVWRKLNSDDQINEIHNLREKGAYALCLFRK